MFARLFAMALALAVITFSSTVPAADAKLRPFVLGHLSDKDAAATLDEVKGKLTGAGFQIIGQHAPYAGTTLVVVTSDELKQNAAQSEFGGYGAVQRISLTQAEGKVQVSYTNPRYLAAAYRMKGDLGGVAAKLASALGATQEFGSADGLTADDLRDYHYMFGMEYFDEPSVLAQYASQADAVAAVEKGLAAGTSGITKVFRVDIPGKPESVFGVAMNGSKGDGTMQDDAYIMNQIDFKALKQAAHLPYEMLVSNGTVYALYARFRIAISFPDLGMMGSNSFMSIMECPTTIEKALTLAAGGTPKKRN